VLAVSSIVRLQGPAATRAGDVVGVKVLPVTPEQPATLPWSEHVQCLLAMDDGTIFGAGAFRTWCGVGNPESVTLQVAAADGGVGRRTKCTPYITVQVRGPSCCSGESQGRSGTAGSWSSSSMWWTAAPGSGA
jgi:hypothetical protein